MLTASPACPLQLPRIVKDDLCLPDRKQIAHEILAYLADHPDAEDTLDGIVQWWLLERKIKYQKNKVINALDELISDGYILKQATVAAGHVYVLNKNKKEELLKILSQKSN